MYHSTAIVPHRKKPIAGNITVVCLFDPFKPRDKVVDKIPATMSCGALVETYVKDEHVRKLVQVYVNGKWVPEAWLPRIKPKAGATVIIRVMPGVQGLIGILASAAGAAVEAWLVSAGIGVAFNGLGAALAGAVVSFAILAVGQALFGPSRPTPDVSQGQVYGITGTSNRITRYAPVPCVMGTIKMVPPLAAQPFTIVRGDDQYLVMLFTWGYGPVDLSKIRIGNTPIGKYEDVEMEHDLDGTATTMELYPNDVSMESFSGLRIGTNWVNRTTPIGTRRITVSLSFPNGLARLNIRNGAPDPYVVKIQAQYQRVTDSSWTDWFTEYIYDDTRSLKRFEKRIAGLTRAQYRVRLRRVDIELDETLPTPDPDENISLPPASITSDVDGYFNYYRAWEFSQDRTDILDDVFFVGLLATDPKNAPVELAGVAKTAIQIRATDQLQGVIDQFNAVVSHKVDIWNGSEWVNDSPTQSSNPAAWFRYVLTGPPNKRAIGNTGIRQNNVGYWYDFCVENGFRFDAEVVGQQSVRDTLRDICAAGRAAVTIIDGKWDVIIQEPLETVVQHFTPRNTRAFRISMPFAEVPHGIRVQFRNEDKDYIEDERVVYDDGYNAGNSSIFTTLSLPGQTNKENVYKLARVLLAATRLRPEVFTFITDIEHIVCTRGDLVRLQHDVALIGQTAGRVVAVDGSTVTLDEAVRFADATTEYRLRFRQPDGTSRTTGVETPASAIYPVETYEIEVEAPGLLSVGDLFIFGERSEGADSLLAIVADIRSFGRDHEAEVTCVPYSEDFYTAGDEIPEYEPVISDPVGESFTGPYPPVINDVYTDERALGKTARGDYSPAMLVYAHPAQANNGFNGQVVPPTHMQARWRRADRPRKRYTWSEPTPVGSPILCRPVRERRAYRLQVRALGANGEVSSWSTVDSVTVLGFGAVPSDVDEFYVTTNGDHSYLEWEHKPGPDVIGYEIRWHPKQDRTNWEKMSTLAEEVSVGQRSFPIPSREGSFGIKAVDALGNVSENAVFTNATEDDPRVGKMKLVTSEQQDPTFPHYHFNTKVDGALLQLENNDRKVRYKRAYDTFTGQGYYYFGEIDLGGVFTVVAVVDPEVDRVSDQNNMVDWDNLSSVATMGGEASTNRHRVWVEFSFSREDVARRYRPEINLGTPDESLVQGDDIAAGTFTGNQDFCFMMQVSFPPEEEGCTGTLLEYSDETGGLYVGIVNDELVMRAGNSTNAANVARASTTMSNFYGRHGLFVGRIDVSAGTAELVWTPIGADNDRIFITGTAASGFPSSAWADGSMPGKVGGVNGNVPANPVAEDDTDFTGMISRAHFWDSTYTAVGAEGTIAWKNWRRISGRTQVTARNLRFRAVLATKDKGITPAVELLTVKIRALVESYHEYNIASGTGGKAVSFPVEFIEPPSIQISGQSLNTGDYYRITGKTASGCTVEFFNSGGTSIDITFDYTVTGYGRKKT